MSETLEDITISRAAEVLRRDGKPDDADELLRVWGLPTVQEKRAGAVRTIWTVAVGVIAWLCATVWILDMVYAVTGNKGLFFLGLVVCLAIGIASGLSFAARRGLMD